MHKVQYKRCVTRDELEQILAIQKRNLPAVLNKTEMEVEGFVTVSHDLQILERMNDTCPHIIAKAGEAVAGYALCMDRRYAHNIPILKPMFNKIDVILDKDVKYMVMGQICVDRSFRRKGLFTGLYNYMRDQLKSEYDLIITEVDTANTRSLGAHYTIGFTDLLVYQSDQRTWHLIQWSMENN